MKYLFLIMIGCFMLYHQALTQNPQRAALSKKKEAGDSSRVKTKSNLPLTNSLSVSSGLGLGSSGPLTAAEDSLVKLKLVKLALSNPQLQIADATVRIAQSDISRAKSSWLSSIAATGNINEFVVQGTAGALYYPKYNFGMVLPFDIFSKSKNEKITAKENLIISEEMKKDKSNFIKAQVLMAYENYKEKNEIVFIEKSYIEYEYAADEAAQKAFTDGDITLEKMNQSHQSYLEEKSKLVSKQRDLNVAVIELEQLIGVPMSEALTAK